ncbi:MAG: hypothetical protein NZO58_01280 [Gemmataceae bacterium]|nr:hypothetical protein [Gemmataceae bacterium]
MVFQRSAAAVLLCALAAALIGCGGGESEKFPTTYKVEGTVLRKNGSPYPGGMINFRHTGSDYSANGVIKSDGTFTLETLTRSNKKLPGAVEGEHNVMVLPPGDSQDAAKPIILTKKYVVKAGDNNLTVQLDQ